MMFELGCKSVDLLLLLLVHLIVQCKARKTVGTILQLNQTI